VAVLFTERAVQLRTGKPVQQGLARRARRCLIAGRPVPLALLCPLLVCRERVHWQLVLCVDGSGLLHCKAASSLPIWTACVRVCVVCRVQCATNTVLTVCVVLLLWWQTHCKVCQWRPGLHA
jgi:hypothetical protein